MLTTILILFQILGFVSSINAILQVRTSQGAIAWAISLNTFPLISVPAYWVFGRSKFNDDVDHWNESSQATQVIFIQILKRLQPYFVEAPNTFPEYEAVKALANVPFLRGNNVDLLINGRQTFQSIADGIKTAEKYILFQFYILRDDHIGNQFQKLLIRKAQQGIAVYVLYDELGSKELSSEWLEKFREANIQIFPFNTRQGNRNLFQFNFRNHRKIVVVDGKCAWLGGLNIGDDYLGKDTKLTPWRDTHLSIEGPTALAAQAAFFVDWHWASRAFLPGLDWHPHTPPDANKNVLILASGPADKYETASLFFTNLINVARHRIWIATPYFIPDAATMTALRLALLKGVEVRIITPRLNDNWFVKHAAHVYLSELAQQGAKIYFFENGFMHQKVMLVDNKLSVIGSVNFDNRSFRLNFEITSVVADEDFAAETAKMLFNDIAHSTELTSAYLHEQSLWTRFKAKASALLAPIL